MFALPLKADIGRCKRQVRQGPKADTGKIILFVCSSGRPFSTARKVRRMTCDTGVAVAWRGTGKIARAVLPVGAARVRLHAVAGVNFACFSGEHSVPRGARD